MLDQGGSVRHIEKGSATDMRRYSAGIYFDFLLFTFCLACGVLKARISNYTKYLMSSFKKIYAKIFFTLLSALSYFHMHIFEFYTSNMLICAQIFSSS